jgi:hypothetical protein
MMAFVLNSEEWNFEKWDSDDILNILESVLERVAVSKQRGEKIWIGDDFQSKSMLNGEDLWSFLGNEKVSNISQEVKNELAAWLGTANYYADEEIPLAMMDDAEISVDKGASEQNLDLAWAHHNILCRKAVACLSLCQSGVRSSTSKTGTVSIHYVLDEKSVLEFWRDAIDIERDCRETIERIGPHAFPNLYFYPQVWKGLDDLTDGYSPLRHTIRNYLEGLNDYGSWIFSAKGSDLRRDDNKIYVESSASDKIVMERFAAIQLDVSPEKAKVEDHVASRTAREVLVKGRILYCEWHGKFEPHQNRIYFHKPVPESGHRIVIGKINRHL